MTVEQLNEELKEHNLVGYWTIPNTSTGFREPEPNFGPFLWKWREIRAALDKAAEFIRPEEAFRGFIGFQHPAFKMGTAHTLLMGAQMVRPGEKLLAHRHTHTVVYHAFKGGGTTYIGDQRFDWQQGDSFVLPLWHWHSHENSAQEPAILFSINDRPAIEALGLFREEKQG